MTKRKRSEGAIQLGKIGRTDEELAARLGRKREQVSYWKTGARVPAAASRELLFAELKIPVEAWDQYPRGSTRVEAIGGAPTGGVIASTPIDYEPAKLVDDGSVRAKAARLDRLVRSMLDVIDQEQAKAMVEGGEKPTVGLIERFRLATDAHKLLDKLGRLTGETQQISESRLLRLPAMRRILDRVTGALKPYPAALAAVGAALEQLGGEA